MKTVNKPGKPFREPKEEATPHLSRTKLRAEASQEIEERKIKRLKRRLNWAIFGLVVAIILVLLFMRYVNF